MAFDLKTLTSGMFSRVLLNSNFQKTEDKVNNELVHRSNGSAQMGQDLDMNSNNILNVPDPVAVLDVANKQYVDTLVATIVTTLTGNISTEEQTATQGQTLFVLTTMSYLTAEALSVYINGVRQYSGSFTLDSLVNITFSEGLQEGDLVLFVVNEG